MHELSLCESTIEIIQKQAQQHNVKRVTGVWLEIGALSCIEEHALRFCFDVVCRGTVAEGSQLHIIHKPALAWCWDCSREVEVTQHEAQCPICSGFSLRIDSGDTLQIKEIEVE